MSKIRELKQEMQVIEVKPDTRLASDISEKASQGEIEQSVMSIVKTQHHHADGSGVHLEVVHQEEQEFQRKMAKGQSPTQQRNLDSVIQENLPKEKQTEEEERRKSSIHQGQWSSNYKAGESGGMGASYQSKGGGGAGVDVQCNCGQEFHFGGAQAQQLQSTAEKMDAQKMKYTSGGGGAGTGDSTRQQYAAGGGTRQTYDSGSDDGWNSDYRR